MAGRLKKEQLILYLSVTIVYMVLWIHTDLARYPGKFTVSLLNNLWQVVYVVGVNMLYFEYVLPYVTSRKAYRLITIVSSVVVHLIVFGIGLYAWRALGTIMNIYEPLRKFSGADVRISDALVFTPGAFLLFAVFKLFFDYTQLKYEGQQARLEKKQAELLFLKAQINPHFLFNTLNNIYSLSQYRQELVSESVLRLSKILRYLLYETDNDLITIDKEIKIINDYLDLEKLRYNENVTIDFKNDIEDPSDMMPPLLLIPLVENAFKHGVSESRGKRFIHVMFTLKKRQLYFTVNNSSDVSSDDQEIKENIGLSNLRRRLSLLYKEFDLITEQKDSIFTAILKINLASHV
jgi:two-component system, LytTR family, sensor kinase